MTKPLFIGRMVMAKSAVMTAKTSIGQTAKVVNPKQSSRRTTSLGLARQKRLTAYISKMMRMKYT